MLRLCDCVIVVSFIYGAFVYTDAYFCGQVHLTVSPRDAYLEMNWITQCDNLTAVPDEIILSGKNLQGVDEDQDVRLRIKPSIYPSGYFKTRVKFGHPFLPGGWDYVDEITSRIYGPHCFPYWIASSRSGIIVDSRCLAIQPTWMDDNRDSLGEHHIDKLLIPGTHNSGAFFGGGIFQEKFILNQDRDIWTQLVFGIRYLDFRVGYYKTKGFYLNHSQFVIQEIRPLFQQIRKFLQASPGEIVILDFHRFPYPSNFTLDIHEIFMQIVQEDLGHLAVPVIGGQKGPTLKEIWATNKSLIICYNNLEAVRASREVNFVETKPWLWYPLRQYWGDTKSLSSLKKYIEKSIFDERLSVRSNPLWALMAELTPQPLDIVFGTYNLKKLAEDSNREITKWFRDEVGNNSNIVATDYFLGNDIIDVAIEINTKGRRLKTLF